MNGAKCLRTMSVSLKSDPTYGLGLSFGLTDHNIPVVIGIDSEGSASKNGRIRVGDRVLEVNGVPMKYYSVKEWRKFIFGSGKDGKYCVLTIEYDVSILSNIRAIGRILIEVGNFKGNLGLTVSDTPNSVIITKVGLGSFAERCGAFQVGDTIIAVRSRKRRLIDRFTAEDFAKFIENRSGSFGIEILVPYGGQEAEKSLQSSGESNVRRNDLDGSPTSACTPHVREETQMVTLDLSSFEEYGIALKKAHTVQGAVVCHIASNSPAAQSGILQIGDRIIMVNGLVLTNVALRLEDVAPKLHLMVHFDVQVWPDERKPLTTILLQRNFEPDFGFLVECYESEVVVASVQRGSVAHRCGQIQVGDILININGVKVNEKEAAQDLIKLSRHTLHLQLIPSILHCGDSGISSFHNRSQPEIIYSSLADNREVLDWGMESNSSDSDCLSLTSSEQFGESSVASSVDVLSHFLYSIDLSNKKKIPFCDSSPLSSSSLTRIEKAHLKIDFWDAISVDSKYEYISLKRIPIPLNSSFCSSGWLEYQDKSPKRKVEVNIQRETVLQNFGFSVIEQNGRLFVKNIQSGSPAYGQLRFLDEIIRINGNPLRLTDGVSFVKLMANMGKSLTMTVARKEALQGVKRLSRWVDEIATEA